MIRKLLFIFLSVFLLTFSNSVLAFNDVDESHDYSEAIFSLAADEVIVGYENGDFGVNKPVNRAEMLKIAMELSDLVDFTRLEEDVTLKNCFPDVKEDWFAKYVCYAKNEGWVHGTGNGFFHPENSVNFVEAAKLIVRVSGKEVNDLTEGSEWFEPFINFTTKNYLTPPSVIDLEQELNRGEVAEMLWRNSFGEETWGMDSTFFRKNLDSRLFTFGTRLGSGHQISQ